MNLLFGEITQAGHLSSSRLARISCAIEVAFPADNKHLALRVRLEEDKLKFLTDRHFTLHAVKATQNFRKAEVFCTFPRNMGGFFLKPGLHSVLLFQRLSERTLCVIDSSSIGVNDIDSNLYNFFASYNIGMFMLCTVLWKSTSSCLF